MKTFVLLTIVFKLLTLVVNAGAANGWNMSFSPAQVDQMPMGTTRNVSVNATRAVTSADKQSGAVLLRVALQNSNPRVVRLAATNSSMVLEGRCSSVQCVLSGGFKLEALLLGFSSLSMVEAERGALELHSGYEVAVVAKPSSNEEVFNILLIAVIALVNFAFGCTVELDTAKEVFKTPVAPLVGFICQYTIMPSASFLYGYLLDLPPALRLGLLTVGCSPGGGSSNMLTLLLNGDVTLSLCMTFISMVAALAMMPLWLLTLGTYITGSTVVIPFVNLATSLATFIIPLLLGIAFNKCSPKVSKVVQKVTKPITFILVICVVTFGIISKNHLLLLLDQWRPIVAAILVPITALGASAVLAVIARQPKKRVLTIIIETCVQNTAVAMVVLLMSLEQPSADMASIMPLLTTAATQVPFGILIIVTTIVRRCRVKTSGRYDVCAKGLDNKGAMVVNGSPISVISKPCTVASEAKTDTDLAGMF